MTTLSTRTAILAMAAAAVVALALTTGPASAKGPVRFEICGKERCIERKDMRLTAAMLYGGKSRPGPPCAAPVHRVTALFWGGRRNWRRFLVHAPRGLIGEPVLGGLVWWRKVRGSRKDVLVRRLRAAGPGAAPFPGRIDLPAPFSLSAAPSSAEPPSATWRWRADGPHCLPD